MVYGNHKDPRPPVAMTDRPHATKLHVTEIAEGVTEQDIIDNLCYKYGNVDKSKSKVFFLESYNDPRAGRYCMYEMAYVLLVSSTNGAAPTVMNNLHLPFRAKPWEKWMRKPDTRRGIIGKDQYENFIRQQLNDTSISNNATAHTNTQI